MSRSREIDLYKMGYSRDEARRLAEYEERRSNVTSQTQGSGSAFDEDEASHFKNTAGYKINKALDKGIGVAKYLVKTSPAYMAGKAVIRYVKENRKKGYGGGYAHATGWKK